MITFLIVRYSVWTPSGGAYVTARRVGLDRYKQVLFSPERMAMRAWLFEHVMLNSLLQQKPAIDPARVRLLVFTSDQLPAPDRARLDDLLAPHPWAQVVAVSDGRVLRERLIEIVSETLIAAFPGAKAVPYATLRLDDDDALSYDFLARMGRYVNAAYGGMCVSFGRGFAAWVDAAGQFTRFRTMVFPNLAVGLAYIGLFRPRDGKFLSRYRTIFGLYRHTHVHLKAPTILSCRRPSYIRTLYRGQDSRSLGQALYEEGVEVSPETVRRWTPVHEAMLAAYSPPGPEASPASPVPDAGR